LIVACEWFQSLTWAFVDTQEVALAHIIGAYSEKAQGRHILVGTNTGYKEMAEVTRQKFPEYPFPRRAIPKSIFCLFAPYMGSSRHTARANIDVPINFDNSKSVKELGIKYHPLTETMQDMFQQLVDEGVVKKRRK
jgi:nucleoside-diphosphate-sugar epimerase